MGYTEMSNQRVPVVDSNHQPLMPTTASRARRWIELGKAVGKWSDIGVFYVQLTVEPSGRETQPIAIGIDPGKRYTGIAVQSQRFTLGMFHLVLMGFLSKNGTAIPGIKDKMDYRRMLRHSRRGRRINRKAAFKKRNHRQERVDNRRQSKLPPSIRSNRQLELRVVAELCKIVPVTHIVYEVLKADIRNQKRNSFSVVMVGQNWIVKQLQDFGTLITREGWQTAQLRQQLGLVKQKQDKSTQSPETHATDGIALASSIFVKYQQFQTVTEHGHHWVGSVGITPSIFKVISRPRITRRRLHDAVPRKGGVRERYGGSTTPFGIRKGDLVAYGNQLGYCSGFTKNQLSISNANWKRLGQRAISKCRLVARSTGLVVSGALNPTQPPLLSLPDLLGFAALRVRVR